MNEIELDNWKAQLKQDIFRQLLNQIPIVIIDEKDNTSLDSKLLTQIAKETNKVVDILVDN